MDTEQDSGPRPIRLFISHSHFEREIAGAIKKVLELYFGFEVFVAHDDIEPLKIFEDRIKEEIASTDVVLAILSPNFKDSKYCDQEIGIAIAKEKFIIPVSYGIPPYGFIAKFQAMPCKVTSTDLLAWIDFCERVVSLIEENDKFKGRTKELIVKAFKNSFNYQTSKRIAQILRKVNSLTPAQLDQIFTAYFQNSQIKDEGYDVPSLMNYLVRKFSSKIDPNLLNTYLAK